MTASKIIFIQNEDDLRDFLDVTKLPEKLL